jgi:hypothetical protein
MKALWFAAAHMLKRPADVRSEGLRLSILCAFGQLALEGRRPLYRDTLCSALRGCIAIHGSAALLPGVDRVTLAWTARSGDGSPATAEIEVERRRSGRRRPPLQVQVQFPDELLGLENLLGLESSPRVAGLYFNLTRGELVGNLYGAIAPVCAAFALAESLTADIEAALPYG